MLVEVGVSPGLFWPVVSVSAVAVGEGRDVFVGIGAGLAVGDGAGVWVAVGNGVAISGGWDVLVGVGVAVV